MASRQTGDRAQEYQREFRAHTATAFMNTNEFYLDTNSSPHLRKLFKDWPDHVFSSGLPPREYKKALENHIRAGQTEGWELPRRKN